MTTIDQRILIPTAPDVVWEYICDINNNLSWQVDYAAISFLSSRKQGSGARWRYTDKRRREFVIEITTWYDGLGYEYTFVDGEAFRENVGRIRLQEIPEGTVVQWTFSYEMGGLLGGLSNAMGKRRRLEKTMVNSLRELWQVMRQQRRNQPFESKSLMQEAPDVEARSRYRPRHPSSFGATLDTQETAQVDLGAAQPDMYETTPPTAASEFAPVVNLDDMPAIPEPPVDEIYDTRPSPAVGDEQSTPATVIPDAPDPNFEPMELEPALELSESDNIEPEFLADALRFAPPEPPIDEVFDTQPNPAMVDEDKTPPHGMSPVEPDSTDQSEMAIVTEPLSESIKDEPLSPPEMLEPEPASGESPPLSDHVADEPAAGEPDEELFVISADHQLETTIAHTDPSEPLESAVPTGEIAADPQSQDSTAKTVGPGSDDRSIWEVFNVPRPGTAPDTTDDVDSPGVNISEAASLTAEDEPPANAESVETPAPSAEAASLRREGLRRRLRTRNLNLRLPE